MATRIITIANNKGGVAKTTTAFNLAKGLARKNKKVLLIDLDPQGNATALTGLDTDTLTNTIANIFNDKNTPIKNLILQVDDIHLIGANPTLQDTIENHTAEANINLRLKTKLKELDGLYNYIIIDTPPSTSKLTKNGIIASTEILIPIQAEFISLQGTDDFLTFINNIDDELKEIGQPTTNINGALITMIDKRTKLNTEIEKKAKEILQQLNIKSFNTTIARNVKIGEAPTENKSIFDYDIHSQGAIDYEALTQEIIAQETKGV